MHSHRRVDPFQISVIHIVMASDKRLFRRLKQEFTVPFNSFSCSLKSLAAPKSVDAWQSWPQACITRSPAREIDSALLHDRECIDVRAEQDRWSVSFFSFYGRDAARIIRNVCTGIPIFSSSETRYAVVSFSSKESSACSWRKWRSL